MADNFVGEIRPVGFNFAPKNWAFCQGQTLRIAQNQALFRLMGTSFGGDGVHTFALPDLRSRVAVGAGQGSGPLFTVGQVGGEESITLQESQMPLHTHTLLAALFPGYSDQAAGGFPAISTRRVYNPYDADHVVQFAPQTLGGSAAVAHENRQPSLTINYIIALTGIYPTP